MKSSNDRQKKFRKPNFEHFFFGYSQGPNARFGYCIKRLIWLALIISVIKYFIELLWGLIVLNDFGSLVLIFPIIVAGGIALLFFHFE